MPPFKSITYVGEQTFLNVPLEVIDSLGFDARKIIEYIIETDFAPPAETPDSAEEVEAAIAREVWSK